VKSHVLVSHWRSHDCFAKIPNHSRSNSGQPSRNVSGCPRTSQAWKDSPSAARMRGKWLLRVVHIEAHTGELLSEPHSVPTSAALFLQTLGTTK
jgi:hypothetical protein